jgi:uncharacterized protein (TIGR02266 family)
MLRKKLIRRFDSRNELSTATWPTLAPEGQSDFAERSRARERTAPRIEARLVTSVELGESSYVGFTENLSQEGVFVSTQAPQRVGARVYLLIALPDLALVHAEGTVRWTRTKSKGISAGIGIHFDKLSALDSVLISDFLRARRSSLMDDAEGMRLRSA